MLFFEDIEPGRVSEFGAYEVTKEEILDFAGKYDPQPFHLDEALAAKSFLGSLCASGWHTCAMTMRMLVDWFLSEKLQGLGSPGVKDLSWRKPVTPGMVLTTRVEVVSAMPSRSKPMIGVMTNRVQTRDKNSGAEVLDMMASVLVLRKQPGGQTS